MYIEKLESLISQNKDIFYKELKEVIKPSFDGLDNPSKYTNIVHNMLKKANRKSFARQARLVSAATEYITKKNNKSLLISSEMGTGKTDMGLKLSMADKFKVNFILCPPHLVDKWEDEIKVNYVDHKSFKVIKVNRWEDLIPYTKRDMRKDGIKYYFIVSRETAKLGYPKQPAIKISFKQIIKEKMLDGESLMVKQLVKVARCPDCYSVLEEGNSEFIDTSTIPYKCECGAVLRSVDRTVSPNMQTRISIAEYVKRTWTKGAIDLLIVDEIHEYKGGNTGQGNALAQLASMSKKIVGLTGTLLNGYASSLFYILYRLNPNLMKKRLGYDYNQVKLFVETYGAHEQIVEAKEVTHEGVVTKMGKQISLKEKPKISPYLLSVLLDMTIFLRLDEIKMDGGLGLPDYDESIELVEMDENLRKPYMAYLGEISSRIRKDKRFLGNLATDAIAVPDMPFQIHSAQNEIFYEPEFTREDYGYTNKEKRLLEIVKSELKNGRRCLVYVHFSNKGVGDDITNMLTKELPQYSTKFLSPTIAAKKRQAWIEKNPSDVLVCNPELVKTGLDLLQFPTIIFYETTYNVFTLKQASRRSWRIGQRDDVKVMFMAYENTPQHKALELIGAKVAAANSLEGRLSGDDDLSSMADEDDNIQLALAKAILKGESASKDIQMNSIKNFGNDRDWDNFELWYKEQMELYKELPKPNSEPKIVEDLFKDFESVKTVAFSKDDRDWQMYKNMAKELLKIYHNGNLYGKQNKYTDDKGKEQTSWSYAGGSHCFERCDEYNNGLVDGLSYSINRASSNYCIVNGIEIYRVKIGKAPFEPVSNSKILMPILKFEEFIDESKEDIEALANLIKEFVNSHKSEKAVIADSLFDFDEELTSNTFFYYSGKGKNKKKVEVNSANLVGYVPPEDLKGGIQLSLF